MSHIARGAIYLTVSQVLFMLSGYVTNIFLGRYLGPVDYGIYGVLVSLMATLNVMQISGIPQAVSKFTAENNVESKSILATGLRLQIFVTLLISSVLFLFAPIIASIFHNPQFTGYTRVLALILPFYGIFGLYVGYYNGLHKFKTQSLLNSVYSIAKLILVILLTIKFGLYGALVGFILAPIFAIFFARDTPKALKLFPYRPIVKFSIPLVVYALLSSLIFFIDIFSLKAIDKSPAVTGFYTAAQNIAIITYFSFSAISLVMFPNIAKLISQNKLSKAAESTSSAFRWLIILLLPLSALTVGSAPTLINLLYGSGYVDSVLPLRILVLGYIGISIFTLAASILNGAGQYKITQLSAGVGVLIALLSCIILIPQFGSSGAALSTAIAGTIVALVNTITLRRLIPHSIGWRTVIKIASGALMLLIISWFVQPPAILLPPLWLFLATFYVVWLFLCRILTRRDLLQIRQFV